MNLHLLSPNSLSISPAAECRLRSQAKLQYVKRLKLYQQWRKDLTQLNKPKSRLIGLYLDNEIVKVSSSHSTILGHAFYVDEWCRSNKKLHDKLQTLLSKYNVTGLVINDPYLKNVDIPCVSFHTMNLLDHRSFVKI
ncbi:hypothetical protein Ddye_011776 [Dipteronia dyeriana]|uniref:Uncharacterized protein n=1 Tax=Dipteronia dyeriana TaxID=168575 RepID=A0AAD9X384_9ROSI|nr:hypothetical protein Ddye_011776 [Dipteronia dyeriana]